VQHLRRRRRVGGHGGQEKHCAGVELVVDLRWAKNCGDEACGWTLVWLSRDRAVGVRQGAAGRRCRMSAIMDGAIASYKSTSGCGWAANEVLKPGGWHPAIARNDMVSE